MKQKQILQELTLSKLIYDKVQHRQQAARQAKLDQFLARYQHASQWQVCLAALSDAARHGVKPSDKSICDAITRCGMRGKLPEAKRLYTSFYKRIGKPRSVEAHVAFMSACADCADFAEAHQQFQQLWDRDRAVHAKDAKHHPVVTDDLTTEYLRAALAASVKMTEAPQGSPQDATRALTPSALSSSAASSSDAFGRDSPLTAPHPPWQTALSVFLALRADTAYLRKYNDLTPLLLEQVCQLAAQGGQWALCLRVVRGAVTQQATVPPEAYDAAVRACFHAQKHLEVVSLTHTIIASKTPPDERSVRLALISAEEVGALEREAEVAHPTAWALALTLFNAMQQNGLMMHQQSYEAPLRACAMAGQWARALDVLRAMRRDGRPVSSELYRLAIASRIEHCGSYEEMQRFLRLPVCADGSPSVVVFLAALRGCMRLADWKHFDALDRQMKAKEMPESYDKMRLLIEAAYLRGNYHSVLMRFARFDNITSFERSRVEKDEVVRLYDSDFDISDRLLDMVLDSYEKVKATAPKDELVLAAYRAALRRKERHTGPRLPSAQAGAPTWMFSAARPSSVGDEPADI